MMGTLSFFNIFFALTQSFLNFFLLTHSWMSTHPLFSGHSYIFAYFFSIHSWMSECPVTQMNKWLLPTSHNSCHTCEGVKACFNITHVRCECFSSLRMSQVTHVNKCVPCHTYEWMSASHVTQFMSHVWMGKCLSWCNTYECVGASLQQYSQTFARTCFQKNSSPSRYRYPLPFRGEKFHLSFPRFRENLLLKIFFSRENPLQICARIYKEREFIILMKGIFF